jgi:hypothetical protein
LLADSLEKYVGKYFSQEYIRKYIFKQSEKEINEQDKKIKSEGPYEPAGMDTSLGGTKTPDKSETLV